LTVSTTATPAPSATGGGQGLVIKARKDEEVLETWFVDVSSKGDVGRSWDQTVRVDVRAVGRRLEEVEVDNLSKLTHKARLSRVELLALLEVLKHYELSEVKA
jgi:hypothetical protein